MGDHANRLAAIELSELALSLLGRYSVVDDTCDAYYVRPQLAKMRTLLEQLEGAFPDGSKSDGE